MNPCSYPPLFVNKSGREAVNKGKNRSGGSIGVLFRATLDKSLYYSRPQLPFDTMWQLNLSEICFPLLAAVLGDEAISEVKSPLCKIKAQILPIAC